MSRALQRTSITFKVLSMFIGLCVVALFALGWRLNHGYISLSPLKNYLEQIVSDEEAGIHVTFEDAHLIWRPGAENTSGRPSFEIRMMMLEIRDPVGELIASLPEGGIQISGLGLLRGMVAPTLIDLSGLSLRYKLEKTVWKEEDHTNYGQLLQDILGTLKTSDDLFSRLFRQMLLAKDRTKAVGYLEAVTVRHAEIAFVDVLSGQQWTFPDTLLQLQRTDNGVALTLNGKLTMEDQAIEDQEQKASDQLLIPTVLTLDQDRDSQMTRIRWQFEGVNPTVLAGNVPALAKLTTINGAINGFIELFIGADLLPSSMLFDLGIGKGELEYADLFVGKVPFDQISLSGRYEQGQQRLQLDNIFMAFGESQIDGNGLIFGSLTQPDVSLLLRISQIDVATLPVYFPLTAGTRGAYNWISENISAGMVKDGDVTLRLTPDMWAAEKFPDDALDFRFSLEDVTAHYLRPMPPITQGQGYARLGFDSFSLTLEDGKVDDLRLGQSKLLFSHISHRNEAIADIDVQLGGELTEVLRVIDFKPLEYPHKFGIKPEDLSGRAQAALKLNFPLIKDLKLDDVTFSLKGEVSDFSFPELTESLSLSEGKLSLTATGDDLRAEGPLKINGVPMEMSWLEDFSGKEKWRTQYRIHGNVLAGEWGALHMPFDDYVEGVAAVKLSLDGHGGVPRIGQGQVDISTSKLSFPLLGWEKTAGVPAQVSFALGFSSPGRIDVNNVSLKTEGIQAEADLVIEQDYLASIELSQLRTVKNQFSMSLRKAEDDIYDVHLSAEKFDALPLMDSLFSPSVAQGGNMAMPNMRLHAQADLLYADDGMEMSRVSAMGKYLGNGWSDATLEGYWGTDKKVELILTPGEGQQNLLITSNDAGQVMRGLGVYASGVDGKLEIKAQVVEFDGKAQVGGKVRIDKFRVINSPSFASMLTDRSMERISDTLQKEGIAFDKLRASFRFFDGVLDVDNARVFGSELGLTLSGQVDQRYDELNLKGTMVPAYGLNSILGNVPLIGDILMGGKGKGLFAVNFRVRGTVNKPVVTVNPLSAIAPGFLREIFGVFDGDPTTKREKQEKLQKEQEQLPSPAPAN